MKNATRFNKIFGTALITLFMMPSANAQIWKKLQKSAERTVEKKLERKTEKATGKMMDSILDPNAKSSTKKSPNKDPQSSTDNSSSEQDPNSETSTVETSKKNVSDDLEVYSKFDFVPGDKVLFYDDFSQDFIGDFPSKWNTNGSGEVVKTSTIDGHLFKLKSGHSIFYIPDLKDLPEDYTIEFDIVTQGLSRGTNSGAALRIFLSDEDNLRGASRHYVQTSIPLYQYNPGFIKSNNVFNGKSGGINSDVKTDIREAILNQPHIAIAVTKNRFRLWINEVKCLDIPRMVTELNVLKHIKFNLVSLKDSENLFITNLRVGAGGEDLRRKLLSEGKISTNGILFDSGSANIKPQSLGIVLQISQVLLQDESINLNIVGHTDADGNSDTNMTLSKARAESVKNALVNLYNIPEGRLQTDGQGASVPVADNTTAEGKSQNRRVEFIKI